MKALQDLPTDVIDRPVTPTPKPDDSPVFLTTQEAANLLRISTKALRQMVRLGQLPVRRFGSKGRLWRFLQADLLAPVPTEPSVTIMMTPPVLPLNVAKAPDRAGRILTRVKGGGFRYR